MCLNKESQFIGAHKLYWRGCLWNVWRGSSEAPTSSQFISGALVHVHTALLQLLRGPFSRGLSPWHFKVSPVAVTSARRNVTGCFVSRHWLYPMCCHQHPPERNKKCSSEGGLSAFWTIDWCIKYTIQGHIVTTVRLENQLVQQNKPKCRKPVGPTRTATVN